MHLATEDATFLGLGDWSLKPTIAIPAFSPLDVEWRHAWWAEGPEFVALALADGAEVATFPDEASTLDATQATAANRPLYRTTGGANSQPCVEADGSNDNLRNVGDAGQEMAQPLSLVAIAQYTNVDTMNRQLLTGGNATTDRCFLFTDGGTWRINAGTLLNSAVADDANWHLFVAHFNGATSRLMLDGTQIAAGAAGAQPNQGVCLFATSSGAAGFWAGKATFFGFYAGDVETDPAWADFEAWVEEHYGLTIA